VKTNLTLEQIKTEFLEMDKTVADLEHWWDELLSTVEKPARAQFVRWLKIHDYDLTPIPCGQKTRAA
jgi:hypothetical protein